MSINKNVGNQSVSTSFNEWSIGTVVNRDRGQSGPWSIGTVVNRDRGQSGRWSIGTVVNRDGGQSGRWSIGTVVNRDGGQSGRWSIGTVVNRDGGQSGRWSIGTVVNRDGGQSGRWSIGTVVNRDGGQSGRWSIGTVVNRDGGQSGRWSIGTVVNRDGGQSGRWSIGTVVNRDGGQSGRWSIGTVVNRDGGQSGRWSIGTVVNRDVVNSNVVNFNVVNRDGGIAAQKEFYRLRQKFRKECRKVIQTQARSGAGADHVQYESDWILYDDLIFLVDYIQPRKTTSNYQRSMHQTVLASQTSLLAPSTSSTYLSKQTSNDSLDIWNADLCESLTGTNDEKLSAVHSMAACSPSFASTKSSTSDNISVSTLKTLAANVTINKKTPSTDISKKRKRETIDEVDRVMVQSSQNISSLASTLETALKTSALKQQLTSECTPAA
ncbi:hypothetical protein EAG_06056 [Camponotus floridanus]|uniref:Uncharacterized protein n=1 Tax=Camponotus floridanus TaxID=104421 RepID=E2ADK4_CAMFO|nr:hypothetical protein EAG_06056 [Camponotus floridanus]